MLKDGFSGDSRASFTDKICGIFLQANFDTTERGNIDSAGPFTGRLHLFNHSRSITPLSSIDCLTLFQLFPLPDFFFTSHDGLMEVSTVKPVSATTLAIHGAI